MNDKIHEITKETEGIRQDYLKEQKAVADLENEITDMEKDMEAQRKLLKEAEADILNLDDNIAMVAASLLNIVLPGEDTEESLKAQIADIEAKRKELDSKMESLDKDREELKKLEDQYTEDFKAHEKKKAEVESQENETDKLE
jgi:chromosome segregation ATPase